MSIRFKIIISLFMLTVAIAFTATGVSYWLLQKSLLEDFRGRLKNIAYLGGVSLDVSATERLISHLQKELSTAEIAQIEQSSDYLLLDKQLQTLRGAEPKLIQYVYILVPTQHFTSSRFLVDADVKKLSAKQIRGEPVIEEISHFGLPYSLFSKHCVKNTFATLAITVEENIVADPQYNTRSLSAYAPIRNQHGKMIAVLGIDLKDENIQAALWQSKLSSLIIIVVALLIATIFSIFVGYQLTKGIRLLDSVVKRFAKKQFDVRMPILSEDEIGTLSQSFNTMAQIIDNHAKQMERLLAAYGRFVPHSFLEFLKKDSIIELKLGDYMQQEMTVLFSDIRSFTTLSESMTPKQNFDFINAFLRRVGPVIRNCGGVIDKYIGDAVMALFPNSPADAINAAIQMQLKVSEYNQQRVAEGFTAIAIGVGLHTGNLILGTVGELERMNSTVIADAVNLASRLEGVTKHYGVGIVISEESLSQLPQPIQFSIRFLDKIQVKGKKDPVTIYEVFDADDKALRAFKTAILPQWQQAVNLYFARQFSAALPLFQAILLQNEQDMPTQLYLERLEQFISLGANNEWDGIEVMVNK